MNFASDTGAPAHPAVIEAMVRANAGPAASYGADKVTERVRGHLARVFETQDFDFWITPSGTAANALALACVCPPIAGVLCHETAHIQADERGAVEFFSGGARLLLLSGEGGKIDARMLKELLDDIDPRFVHATPPAALSITNLTECGTAYTPGEVAALSQARRAFGLSLHMDGARFGNALVHTGARPAEMSWKAGVDVLSLGLTKAGAIGCDVVMLFGAAREKGKELRARAKRAGHMPAKMRYLAAQAEAMLEGGLWLELSRHANAMAQKLAAAFREDQIELAWDVQGNEVFVLLDAHDFGKLQEDGASFHEWPGRPGLYRFVCSWTTTEAEIEAVRATLKRGMRK